eukprot:TRINITY_DN11257_c0_g1_i1.p1 TRINITY_DN11257_c0_g1~~TRINITY_DN11257_c0_g1_i1.p1  ORF type:complete len:201 (-),score=2.69 TRINITY_DN11257_c0_g1_i1:125-673(-)
MSAAVSSGVALCCCPLAYLYLLLCCPLSLLVKYARAKRLAAVRRSEAKTRLLSPPPRRFDASVGVVINGCSVTLVWRADLEICASLKLPEAFKVKIAEFKRKVFWRKKSAQSWKDLERDFEVWSPLCLPEALCLSSPSSATDDDSPEETPKGAFDHPFWRENFECSQLGFWRGIDLSCEGSS